MAEKIAELFSFGFDGLIWETSIDPDQGTMLLQARDEDKHQTTFSLVDLHSGHWLIRNREFEESWWIGISALQSGHALLHIYEDEQNPEHKSLLLWDIDNDQLISKIEQVTFVRTIDNGFLIRKGEAMVTIDWNGNECSKQTSVKPRPADNTMTQYPFQYQVEDDEFRTIRSFIANTVNVNPESAAEYLETEQHIFISYYIKEDAMLANYLLVSDLEGKVLLNKKINASAKGTGRDTFFIFERKLIFISNNNTLFVYAI